MRGALCRAPQHRRRAHTHTPPPPPRPPHSLSGCAALSWCAVHQSTARALPPARLTSLAARPVAAVVAFGRICLVRPAQPHGLRLLISLDGSSLAARLLVRARCMFRVKLIKCALCFRADSPIRAAAKPSCWGARLRWPCVRLEGACGLLVQSGRNWPKLQRTNKHGRVRRRREGPTREKAKPPASGTCISTENKDILSCSKLLVPRCS